MVLQSSQLEGLLAIASPHSHYERVGDRLRCHRRPHLPADDSARVQTEHDGYVQPALGGPQEGEIIHSRVSTGRARHLGRVLSTCARVRHSLRCSPQWWSAPATSRHTGELESAFTPTPLRTWPRLFQNVAVLFGLRDSLPQCWQLILLWLLPNLAMKCLYSFWVLLPHTFPISHSDCTLIASCLSGCDTALRYQFSRCVSPLPRESRSCTVPTSGFSQCAKIRRRNGQRTKLRGD